MCHTSHICPVCHASIPQPSPTCPNFSMHCPWTLVAQHQEDATKEWCAAIPVTCRECVADLAERLAGRTAQMKENPGMRERPPLEGLDIMRPVRVQRRVVRGGFWERVIEERGWREEEGERKKEMDGCEDGEGSGKEGR